MRTLRRQKPDRGVPTPFLVGDLKENPVKREGKVASIKLRKYNALKFCENDGFDGSLVLA